MAFVPELFESLIESLKRKLQTAVSYLELLG